MPPNEEGRPRRPNATASASGAVAANIRPVIVACLSNDDEREALGRVLRDMDLTCEDCDTQETLIEAIENRRGPILVAEDVLDEAGVARVSELLASQPEWSELPVVVLADSRGRVESRLASVLKRPGVRWLQRPVEAQALTALIEMASEAWRRQWHVRQLLRRQEQLNERLSFRTAQLQQLAGGLIEAEDRERRRIAELLHDDLQQLLVGAGLQLAAAFKHARADHPIRGALDRLARLITDAQTLSRDLSHELFPAALRDAHLADALEWLVRTAKDDLGVEVELDIESELDPVDPAIVRFMYRAAREVICNVAKHAGVREATLVASRDGERIQLVVSDQGVGFDPAELDGRGVNGGIGLAAIRERVDSLGGDFRIISHPGDGAEFAFSVPAGLPSSSRAAPNELP